MFSLFSRRPDPVPHNEPLREAAEQFQQRVRRLGRTKRTARNRQRVAVAIFPWVKTAVPFFCMEWGIRLWQEGCEVEFIWDPWPGTGKAPTGEALAILETLHVVRSVTGLRAVHVPEGEDGSESGSKRIAELAFEAVTRKLGREPHSTSDPEVETQRRSLAGRAAVVREFLKRKGYDWIFLPGGVWSVSGTYWDATQLLGTGLTTFDSGYGMVCFQHGGPAAHFPDLKSAMSKLAAACEADEALADKVRTWVDERLKVREAGKDDYQLQPAVGESRAPVDILVPMNYRLDTAAMCRQRVFGSVNEWLRALVNWARAHPEFSIAFRQHPCEKIPEYRSKEDFSWISAEGGPGASFIAGEDPVNTYQLLEGCRLVLPYSSRVGLEGALGGKAVVLAAKAYYDEMPFVDVATSPEDYFQKIESALRAGKSQSEANQAAAYAAYYVAENFGLHRTRFTPQPQDYKLWIDQSEREIWEDPCITAFLQAAVSRVSVADILVEKLIASSTGRTSDV